MHTLRPFQERALLALEKPGNLLCVAPTGSGKSLIYERAAAKPGRRTLLVSPLVALARQQTLRLESSGIVASRTPPPHSKESAVWVVSPEKLLLPPTRHYLQSWRPDFLVVDECHCLWEWGDRFRPAFKLIPDLIRDYAIPSSLWLTATLPHEARQEIRSQIPGPLVEMGDFDLPSQLELHVEHISWTERANTLLGWLIHQKEPGIVFVSTRLATERLARLIRATGRTVQPYHAGLGLEERRAAEASIARGEHHVVVATSAFGMGMNYPHLSWVVLWQAAPSLLGFAQAIGRVGRNENKRARALAFWSRDDFKLLEWMASGSERCLRQLTLSYEFYSESTRCRREALKRYFAQSNA